MLKQISVRRICSNKMHLREDKDFIEVLIINFFFSVFFITAIMLRYFYSIIGYPLFCRLLMKNKSIPKNDCYRMNGQSVSSLKASKDYSLTDSLLKENPLVRD